MVRCFTVSLSDVEKFQCQCISVKYIQSISWVLMVINFVLPVIRNTPDFCILTSHAHEDQLISSNSIFYGFCRIFYLAVHIAFFFLSNEDDDFYFFIALKNYLDLR